MAVESESIAAAAVPVTVVPVVTETETSQPKVIIDDGIDTILEQKIIRQIEYYFGDLNLTKDKFMQEEIQKEEGWVTLDTLIKFNRLKTLSDHFPTIISCLKKSKADLLEIDEEKNRVRRLKALPDNPTEFESELKLNTVYVKGFPEDKSLDDLIGFFEPFGKVLQVYMRRIPLSKAFKGSVFVTFGSKEETNKFMELTEVKHGETLLERETQEAYLTRKAPALAKMKEEKEKRITDKEDKKKEREDAEAAFFQSQKVEGSVLHLKGLPAEGTRENLKELFDNIAKVKWVDYSKGEPEAFLRFVEANKAKFALEEVKKLNDEGKILLEKAELEVRVVEGDEEEQFWKDTITKLVEARKNKNSKGRGGGRNDRNGSGKGDWKRNSRGGGGGGGGGNDRNQERDNKRKNEESSNENKKLKAE